MLMKVELNFGPMLKFFRDAANADFNKLGVWNHIQPEIRRQLEKTFQGEGVEKGTNSFGSWRPVEPGYAKWKKIKTGSTKVMVLEGTLKTNVLGFNWTGRKKEMILRWRALSKAGFDYATFHQRPDNAPPIYQYPENKGHGGRPILISANGMQRLSALAIKYLEAKFYRKGALRFA